MKKLLSVFLLLCLILPGPALGTALSAPERMLREMTTADKIAQLLMPAFLYQTDADGKRSDITEITPEMEEILRKYGFGGIVFYIQNARRNDQALLLTDTVQRANASIPGRTQLITFTDQEGGYVTRLDMGTQMPGSMALGAVNDLSVTRAAGRLIGEEVKAVGYSGTFAPVMDINNNPSNPVINIRSFGDRPEQVSEQGVAFLLGLHDAGALAAIKHFPGHGDTDTDSHTGLPVVNKTYDELKAFELIPFQAGIDAGADMVMTAHIVYPQIEKGTWVSADTGKEIGLPATLSRTILTDILRGDMGFQGLIVTDAMDMDAIATHFRPLDALKLSIEAGADLIVRPVNPKTADNIAVLDQYIQAAAAMADEGKISMDALDAAVLRVLRFKEKHGLLDPYNTMDPDAKARFALSIVGSQEHHELEWDIAKKAVTLVRGGSLPVNVQESVAVLVPYASQINSVHYALRRLREENILPEGTDIPVYQLSALSMPKLTRLAQNTRQIIAVSAVYSADEMNPLSSSGANTALIDAVITLAQKAGNAVTVVSTHLPYDIAHFRKANALVVAYGARGMTEDPREAQNGVIQYGPNLPAAIYMILSGGPFSGILPVDIPVWEEEGGFVPSLILFPHGLGLKLNP